MPHQSQVRAASAEEMNLVYAMGFDVWSDGATFDDYLVECRRSKKYAAGEWRVLEHPVHGLLASMLIHNFSDGLYGFGSIATVPAMRRRGAATRLIATVLEEIESRSKNSLVFLYSDIDAEFYRRFDFESLPTHLQKYKTTTCMARPSQPDFRLDEIKPESVPAYF